MAAAKVSGFFSSLKKEVLTIGQTKTVDHSFESAKTNYDAFVFSVQTLQTHVNMWVSGAKQMAVGSEHVGNDYKNVMQQNTTHPFSALATDGKSVQNAVFKHFEGCEKQLDATVMSHFKELNAHFAAIKDRIKKREEARLDFDYRTSQVKSAHESRDKALAKGKAEAPKDAEKRVVAEKKLEESTEKWTALNTQVISELMHLHEHRLDLCGNLYIEFLAVQRAFAAGMTQNLDSLLVPAIPAASAWNLFPADAKASGGAGPEFSDVSLGGAKPAQRPVSNKPVGGPAVTGPPAGGSAAAMSAQQQQREIDRQNAAAAAIMASMPDNAAPRASLTSEGVNISANFADDDEAAMRVGVTVKPQDAAAAAQFAVKHQAAITKLATVNNKPPQA